MDVNSEERRDEELLPGESGRDKGCELGTITERRDEELFPSESGRDEGCEIATNGDNLTESNVVVCESDFDGARIFDEDENGLRRCEFNRKDMFDEPKLELGMYFPCKSDFTTVVRSVAIKQKRSVKLTKNDGRRVYVKCKDTSCEWEIHLVKIKNEEYWKVNEYYHKHTCKPSYNCSSVKTGWLVEKYLESLKSNPNKGVEDFRLEIVNELKCHVSRLQADRVRRKALKLLEGNHSKTLSIPWDYNKDIRTAPGAMVVMETVECNEGEIKEMDNPTKKRKLELCESLRKHAKVEAGKPESREQYRTKRQQKTVACKLCGEQGHNKRGCNKRKLETDKGKAPIIEEEEVNYAGALVVYSQTVEEEEAFLNANKNGCENSDDGAAQIPEDDGYKDPVGSSTINDIVEDQNAAVAAQSESDRLRLILSVVNQMKEADSLIKVQSLVALTSRTLQKFIEKETSKEVGKCDKNHEAVGVARTINKRVGEDVTIGVGKAVSNGNNVQKRVDVQKEKTKKISDIILEPVEQEESTRKTKRISDIILETVEQREKTKKTKVVYGAENGSVDLVRSLDARSESGNPLCDKQSSCLKVMEIADDFNRTPLIIPFSFDIFCLEYNEQLDTNVVHEFLREGPCSPPAMAMYIRFIYESAIIQLGLKRKFAFLSPKEMYIPSSCLTDSTLLDEHIKLSSEYVARVMLTMLEKDGLLLAPLDVGDHWILIAINPGKMEVYLCDSNECIQSKHEIELTIMYRALSIVRNNDESSESLYNQYKPMSVSVPRYEKDDQSGIYVMRFIKEIVYHRVASMPCDFYPSSRCLHYDKGTLEDIKEEWSSYIIEITSM